jgi:lysophospholipase L1-like esterase
MRQTSCCGFRAGVGALCVSAVALSVLRSMPADADEPTAALSDGDRVTIIGGTLIERGQQYGYWETLLTCRYPNRRIAVRNLGWSADDVEAEAWSGFDTPVEGFARRKRRVEETEPTVVVIALGMAESFDGPEGLPHYVEGLNRVIDTVPTGARVVLMSPNRHEDLGRPLPDPTEHNRQLAMYRDAMCDVAAGRGLVWLDLFAATSEADSEGQPMTDNGVHLTEYGYWRTAAMIDRSFGPSPAVWSVVIAAPSGDVDADGTTLGDVSATPRGVRFVAYDRVLPAPLSPLFGDVRVALPGYDRTLSVSGLAAGTYELVVDGEVVVRADADEWSCGVRLTDGPEFAQVEEVRQAVIEKNMFFFHYWRPENFTYLFGHRRHEQGQNAPEVDEFQPLVNAQDELISELKLPKPHTYELRPVAE